LVAIPDVCQRVLVADGTRVEDEANPSRPPRVEGLEDLGLLDAGRPLRVRAEVCDHIHDRAGRRVDDDVAGGLVGHRFLPLSVLGERPYSPAGTPRGVPGARPASNVSFSPITCLLMVTA